MTHLRIQHTMRGATTAPCRSYKDKTLAMKEWDKLTDSAIGGDQCRLVDLETGRIVSEYNPVDRGIEV